MRVRKYNIPAVTLTKLRWLGTNEIENQKPFGKELCHIIIERPGQIKFDENKNIIIGWKKYGGFIYGILAAICFSLTSFTSELLLQKKYHTYSITLWKYQGMTIIGPILIIYFKLFKKQSIFECIWPLNKSKTKKIILLLMVQGTVGFCSILAQTQSFNYLKLDDFTIISFSTPMTVILFAHVFLGELCGIIPIMSTLITLSGVAILIRPPLLTGHETFDVNFLIGTSFAFGYMLFLTCIFLLIRYLREIHFSLIIIFYGYLATIESIILLLLIGLLEIPQNQEDWGIVGGNAIFNFVGQCFIVLALKYEQAGPVSLIRTLEIIFLFIWQLIIVDVYPDVYSLLGTGVIIFGISVTAFRKWLTTLPNTHTSKKWFWFMLK